MPYNPLETFHLSPEFLSDIRDLRLSYSEIRRELLSDSITQDDALQFASTRRVVATLSFLLDRNEGRKHAIEAAKAFRTAGSYYGLFLESAFSEIDQRDSLTQALRELERNLFEMETPFDRLPGALRIPQQRAAILLAVTTNGDLIEQYSGVIVEVLRDLSNRPRESFGIRQIPMFLMMPFFMNSLMLPSRDDEPRQEHLSLVLIANRIAGVLLHVSQDRFHWERGLSPIGYVDLDLAGLVSLYERRRKTSLEKDLEMSAPALIRAGQLGEDAIDKVQAQWMEVLLGAGANQT